MSLPFDLPSAPLLAGSDHGLPGVPVTLFIFNERQVKARLQGLNAPLKHITVFGESGKLDKINYKQIRYLVFDQEIEAPSQPHPLTNYKKAVEMPAEYTDFKIEFCDGKILSGRTRTSLISNDALHFFHEVGNNKVKRVFIPLEGVAHYIVGDKIGQIFLKKKNINQNSLDTALQLQKQINNKESVSTKEKSGVKNPPYVIEDPQHLREYLQHSISDTFNTSGVFNDQQVNIKSTEFDFAWEKHEHDKKKKLGEILMDMGLLSNEDVYHALAYKLGLPFVKLHKFYIDKKCLSFLSIELIHKYKVVPLLLENNRLIVATSDPTNTEVIDTLRFATGNHIEMTVATDSDVEWAIDQYFGTIQDDSFDDMMQTDTQDESQLSAREAEELAQKRPIVRLVHNILVDAIHRKASDIHLRPEKNDVDLMYRIDGTLIKIRSFSKALLPGVVSRIKILGRMDISERRLPQDGRAQYITVGAQVDLRISIMPTVNGESVVIRILNIEVGLKSIQDLGFSETDHIAFLDLIHKSNGILLVTGPTGSGKSTTLYAALQEIQKQNVNIITIEDPVEYHVDHIIQIQINPATGYTFARALRNILRHDPDVIMVGEIRDQETAKIAVESALTGHLVLSTLHTNDAASTISRLLEMEIEPYLLSSSVIGVLAQRLVRKNCPDCMEEETSDPNVRKALGIAEDEVFYHGVGCDKCNNTGFKGRMGVYELLVITDGIRQYVKKGVTAAELRKIALTEGMISLTQNTLTAARQRKISLTEVYRVRLE